MHDVVKKLTFAVSSLVCSCVNQCSICQKKQWGWSAEGTRIEAPKATKKAGCGERCPTGRWGLGREGTIHPPQKFVLFFFISK